MLWIYRSTAVRGPSMVEECWCWSRRSAAQRAGVGPTFGKGEGWEHMLPFLPTTFWNTVRPQPWTLPQLAPRTMTSLHHARSADRFRSADTQYAISTSAPADQASYPSCALLICTTNVLRYSER